MHHGTRLYPRVTNNKQFMGLIQCTSFCPHISFHNTYIMPLWEIQLLSNIQDPKQEGEFRRLCDSIPTNAHGCPDHPLSGTPNVKSLGLYLSCNGPNQAATTYALRSSRCMTGTKKDAKKQGETDWVFFEKNGFPIYLANIEPRQTHPNSIPPKSCAPPTVHPPLTGHSDGFERWEIRCGDRHTYSLGWM